MPENLKYALPTSPQLKIKTDDFRIRNNLDFERDGNGIYLDIFLEFQNEDGTIEGMGLGTFKILDNSSEAMHVMTDLLGNFILELREFAKAHRSEFIWQGVSVFIYPYEEAEERLRANLLCDDMEAALEMKDQLLGCYPVVRIQDNVARKVVVYRRDGSG